MSPCKDAAYTNIVAAIEKLQQARPETPFNNLVEAVGTNDITKIFSHNSAISRTRPIPPAPS